MSKFNKYSGKVSFVVSGEEISLNRVKTEKLQELMNYTKDSETILVNITEFFVKLIIKNYPEEFEGDVRNFVQQNAMTILEEFQIAYGLMSREELDKAQKLAEEKIANGKIE